MTAALRANGQLIKPALVALLLIFLIVYPLVVPRFWALQIGAVSLFMGIIAMSLIFLAGYAGMFSLAQVALAGVAGYSVAVLTIRQEVDLLLALPMAVGAAALVGALVGMVAVRTQGIYFLMITLAMSVFFYNLVLQNCEIFRCFDGYSGVRPPTIAGVYLRDPIPFYYLCLLAAGAIYLGLRYIVRSPFGLALQGIRDNPRRMQELGYWVNLHRVAAFTLAAAVAGVGGILSVWYNLRISPGTVDLSRTVDALIIAVVGGVVFLEGAFVGAVIFVLIGTFAIDLIDRERFNTLIGLTFLLILLFSPDGVIGIIRRLRGAPDSFRSRLGRAGRLERPTTDAKGGATTDPASTDQPVINPAVDGTSGGGQDRD
jgi:branched-chain amino acid transport system permease protein